MRFLTSLANLSWRGNACLIVPQRSFGIGAEFAVYFWSCVAIVLLATYLLAAGAGDEPGGGAVIDYIEAD